MRNLVLIASYPKSGNTWMRAFLHSLATGGETPDINAGLEASVQLSDRTLVDSIIGIESVELSAREIARIRPEVSRRVAEAGPRTIKAHDAFLIPPGGREPAIPADVIDRVIYIVRDPRDVAISFAHHSGQTVAETVRRMNDPTYAMGRSHGALNSQVEHFLSSWSGHVRSWLDAPGMSVHLMRYEDMLGDPEPTFAAAVSFLGLNAEAAAIGRAIEAVSFQKLAGQEAQTGFRERYAASDTRFFRDGQAGAWREHLAPELVESLIAHHGNVMRRLGYAI